MLVFEVFGVVDAVAGLGAAPGVDAAAALGFEFVNAAGPIADVGGEETEDGESDEWGEDGRFVISHRPTGFRVPVTFSTLAEAVQEMEGMASWDWNFDSVDAMPADTLRRGREWKAAWIRKNNGEAA